MFLLWTIATTWVIFIFDNAWLERPIKDHSIQSLSILMPSSAFEWIIVVSWMVPLLFVIFRALFVRRFMRANKQPIIPFVLPDVLSSLRGFDWILIVLSGVIAVMGWTLETTEMFLPAIVIVIGLSFSKLEHWSAL